MFFPTSNRINIRTEQGMSGAMLMYLTFLNIPFGMFYLLMIVEGLPSVVTGADAEELMEFLSYIAYLVGISSTFYLAFKKHRIFLWVNVCTILLSTVIMFPDGWLALIHEIGQMIQRTFTFISNFPYVSQSR